VETLTPGEQAEALLLLERFLKTTSRATLARTLGVYPQTIHKWIHRQRFPNRESLSILRSFGDKALTPKEWEKIWKQRNDPRSSPWFL
jgi:uncharacterized protein YjcR